MFQENDNKNVKELLSSLVKSLTVGGEKEDSLNAESLTKNVHSLKSSVFMCGEKKKKKLQR